MKTKPKTKTKKAALKKPADRKAAPRTRIEARITKKEKDMLKRYAKSNRLSVTQIIKNWLKYLLK